LVHVASRKFRLKQEENGGVDKDERFQAAIGV